VPHVDPYFVGADRFEFSSQLSFAHAAGSDDLQILLEVQRQLAAKGLKIARGTIVDAAIIDAPSSTKNANASDQEGQPVVFRDEGKFRGTKAAAEPSAA
jgi:hypothetical protein